MYKEPVNSPFVPNDQKEIMERDQPKPQFQQQPYQSQYAPQQILQQKPQAPGLRPLVDLQVYQPSKPKPPPRDSQYPAMYMPIPNQGPYFPPQYNPYWPNLYAPQLVNPVIKQYSINTGPFLEQSTLETGILKEDSLPRQFVNTSNTLGERLNIYNFVRSVFIKHHDGEDIDIDGKGTNSLLKYLKFLELNPYNIHQNETNPYRGLPSDMLIYKSCYPVRYDEKSGSVQCAPNSLGMNIRIYRLSFGEYNVKRLEQQNFDNYNIWREVAYYEYIREYVIKKKVCPNFTIMYGYYINERCNIDFNKVAKLTGKQIIAPQEMILKFEQNRRPPFIQQFTGQQTTQPETYGCSSVPKQIIPASLSQATIDLNAFSGRGLVALTEAPTYNIYRWASKIYNAYGNIHKMVGNGYHKSEVWYSILFQLMVALHVMKLNKIVFNNFSLDDNVYIKDITQHENVVMYWKYKIKNFEYYVPNYGYLLMIDSNYKDVDGDQSTLIRKSTNNFKIYSSFFKDKTYNDKDLDALCFSAFVNVFDPNKFSSAFTNYGGVRPPSDVIALLSKINDEASNRQNMDIQYYIYKYMYKFLNNRVGTYLSDLEVRNVRKDGTKQFTEGQILVQEIQSETYKFVIFVGHTTNNTIRILTKRDPKDEEVIEEDVGQGGLFNYSRTETILQNYKPNEANLNEEELLETYIVGKFN